MAQPILGIKGTAEYIKATGEGTPESPYVPVVQVESGGTGGGGTTTVDFGTKITDSTMPAGGVGNLGWLSAIWKLISDRIPVLSNGKIPVELPTGVATSALQSTSNTSLASIDTKIPLLGQALVGASTPVVLPASQIAALTSPTTGLAYLSTATVTITRTTPIPAYTGNDVYGGVFELQNIGASGGYIFLNSLNIIFNITSLPTGMSSFAVYLFNEFPPSGIADNLPYSLSLDDRTSILNPTGIILTALPSRGGGCIVAESTNINQLFNLATGKTSLWGYLVTLTASTSTPPSSETLTICARSFAP